MFRRLIIAFPALLLPLIMVATAAAASASVASQPGAVAPTIAASVASAQPVLRLGAHGSAVKALQQRLAALHSRYNGWQAGPLGSLYRPNYFYGGYAVHGMTSVPAYPASHGCVRMTVPTMDRMWSSLWAGMPVAIYAS